MNAAALSKKKKKRAKQKLGMSCLYLDVLSSGNAMPF